MSVDSGNASSANSTLRYSLMSQAVAAGKIPNVAGIIELLREKTAQHSELGREKRAQVGYVFTCLADALGAEGEIREAAAALDEAERIMREFGSARQLADCLGAKGRARRETGDVALAMAAFEEQVSVLRTERDHGGLQGALGDQVSLLIDRNEGEKASSLVAERVRICRELGDEAALSNALSQQAKVALMLGDAGLAAKLADQQQTVAPPGANDIDALAQTLCNRGLMLLSGNDFAQAGIVLAEAEQAARRGRNRKVLANTIGARAAVLMMQRDLMASLQLQREAEQICREESDGEGLVKALTMQGHVLFEQGRLAEALPRVEEAQRTATQLGLQLMLDQMIRPLLTQMAGAQPKAAPAAPEKRSLFSRLWPRSGR